MKQGRLCLMEEKIKQEYKQFIYDLLEYEVPEKDLENVCKAFDDIYASLSNEKADILRLYAVEGRNLGYSPYNIATKLGLKHEDVILVIKQLRSTLQRHPKQLGLDMADFKKKTSGHTSIENLEIFVKKVDSAIRYAQKNIVNRPIKDFDDLEQIYNWAQHNVRKRRSPRASLKKMCKVEKQGSLEQNVEE